MGYCLILLRIEQHHIDDDDNGNDNDYDHCYNFVDCDGNDDINSDDQHHLHHLLLPHHRNYNLQKPTG